MPPHSKPMGTPMHKALKVARELIEEERGRGGRGEEEKRGGDEEGGNRRVERNGGN